MQTSSAASVSVGFCKVTSIRKMAALHNRPLLCLHVLSEPPSVETSAHRDAPPPPTSLIVFSQGSIIAATHRMQSAHFLTGVRLALSARKTRPACYSGWNVTDPVSSMPPMKLENRTLSRAITLRLPWGNGRIYMTLQEILACKFGSQPWGRKICWKREDHMKDIDNWIR